MNNIYFSYIATGVAGVAVIWVITLEIRLRKLFRGKKANDLEEIISSIGNEIKELNTSREELEKYLELVEKRLRQSTQQVKVVRFNPFENAGSNQSFAVAFLNEKGDGAVISCLYSRDRVNVYAKPIKNRASEYTLSKEEQEAITSQ